MPRVRRGPKGARRRKAIRKQAKGYSGSRHRLLRTAAESVDKALQHAYVGRRLKKRDFRGLWQTRIAAASKVNGISYSKLIGNLKKKNVQLNRKILSELAISNPNDFAEIANLAKGA